MTNSNDLRTTCIYMYRDKKELKMSGCVICATIILSLFFLHYVTESGIYFAAGMITLLLAWLILDWQKMLLVISVLIPNIPMVKLVGNASAIVGYILFLAALKYFVKNRISIGIPFVFILHAGFACTTAGIYQQWSGILNPLIRTIVFFVFLCSISKEQTFLKQSYWEQLIKSYLLGLCLAVLFGMVKYILQGGNGVFLSGISNDRNYFASMIITGLSIIPLYATAKKKVEFKTISAAAILLYGGLLTSSRTFFIALFAVALLWIIKFDIWHQWKQLLAIAVIVVVFGLVVGEHFFDVVERLMNRFAQDDVYGGNGRFDAWRYYLNLAFSTPLRFAFGNGRAVTYIAAGYISQVEHNTFIEMFFTMGFAGFTTSLLCYSVVIKKLVGGISKFGGIDVLACIPFLICYSGISAMYSDAFNFQFFITLIAIKFAHEKAYGHQRQQVFPIEKVKQ